MNRQRMYAVLAVIAGCFCVTSVQLAALYSGDPLMEILQRVKPQPDDVIIVNFIVPGECVKCNLALTSACQWLRVQMSKHGKVRLVGCINCNREVELKAYRDNYPDYEVLLMDDGRLRQRFGVSGSTRVVVLNHLGKLLGTISEAEYFGKIQEAFQRMLNIQQ